MQLTVDRDSVSMGDDTNDHRRTVEVPDDATVADLLTIARPDIAAAGWTWVCHWNGEPFAVWSSDRGGRTWHDRYRTVADLPGAASGTAELFHAYWLQMDADWLLARLRAGDPLDRRTLEERWRPVAAQRSEEDLRRRGRETPDRLLDPATITALEAFGVRVDVHTDTVCRFLVGEELWRVQRHDTMTILTTPAGTRGSLRPVGLAQVWAVALVARHVTGTEAFAEPLVDSVLRPSPRLWTVTRQVGDRQELAQQRSPEDADWFRRVVGRTVEDVAAAYGRPAPSTPQNREVRRRWWRWWRR